jgi:DNA primase
MRSEDQVIIVEGYMDLVSLYQAGVRNVVATMGTALTPDQCRLIKRITKNVVVLFDGDSAGIEAAEKSLPLLLEAELYPKGLTLPDQQDPDDYVKKYGCEALVTMLQQAPDLFSLVTKNWMQGYTGEASEKVRLCDRLQDIFKAIKDQRLKQLYLEEIAKKLSVTIAWLQQAVEPRVGTGRTSDSTGASLEAAKVLRTSTSGPSNKDAADNTGPNITNVDLEKDLPRPAKYSLKGATRSELILMSLAIKTRANMDLFIKENMQNSVTHPGALGVLQKAQEVYRHEPAKFDKLVSLFVSEVDFPDGLFTESLLKMKDAEMTKNVVNVDLMDSLTEHKLMRDCSKRNKQSQLKLQAKQLLKDLKSGVDSETLEQIMNVQRDRYSLNKN